MSLANAMVSTMKSLHYTVLMTQRTEAGSSSELPTPTQIVMVLQGVGHGRSQGHSLTPR